MVAPEEQSCCGALFGYARQRRRASQEQARRTIDVFERANVEAIVINAAGCGSNVKEYGHLLRDDSAYAERANVRRQLQGHQRDSVGAISPSRTQSTSGAHSVFTILAICRTLRACVRSQGLLLAQIPGLQLMEIAEAPICCGSAGIYNLVQPDAATELGDRKARLTAQSYKQR